MTSTRGLRTGDLVTVPGRRTAVVEFVATDGQWFTDTRSVRHFTADAVLVPIAEQAPPSP